MPLFCSIRPKKDRAVADAPERWPTLQEFERRLWHHRHLLRQFEGLLSPTVLNKLEDMGLTAERLYDMEASEIGAIIRHPAAGATVRGCLDCLPSLSMEAHLQPITRYRILLRLVFLRKSKQSVIR